MKTKNILTVVAAAAFAVFAQGAFAQAASSPMRADVKADAKTGKQPAGEGTAAMSSGASGVSTKSRMERKDETKAAAKSGGMSPAGDAADMKSDKAAKNASTTKTRAERKAETKADAKAGKIQPAGEAPMPASEPPKK